MVVALVVLTGFALYCDLRLFILFRIEVLSALPTHIGTVRASA